MAATLLSADMRLFMRYVASAHNQADASSRGEWRVGVADETVAKGRKAEAAADISPRGLLSLAEKKTDSGTRMSGELLHGEVQDVSMWAAHSWAQPETWEA